MFFVTRFGVFQCLDGSAERRISEVYERNFRARFDAIRKQYGLGRMRTGPLARGRPKQKRSMRSSTRHAARLRLRPSTSMPTGLAIRS
jgi:hypothetical protein